MGNIRIIDGHCDSLGDYEAERRTLKVAGEGGHWNLEQAAAGGMLLQFFAAFIESSFKPAQGLVRGLELIAAAQRFVKENPDAVRLIRTRGDLETLPHSQKTGLLLAVEGGEVLEDRLFMVDILYDLGVRSLGLTWNQRNSLGDGCGEQTRSRLTRFGEQVIKRMNDLGMIIDVSHLNEEGFWHVLELSKRPVLASHSCAHALCPHPRNLTDAQLRALARAGGMVGVNFYPSFLVSDGKADLRDVVIHIAHIARIAGIEAVGLGSDFDGIDRVPKGLDSVADYPKLLHALAAFGFSAREVEMIAYRNFCRFLKTVLN